MRVLVVIPGVSRYGGAEQSLAANAPGLIAEGVGLHIALLTERRDLVPDLVSAGATVHDLSGGRRVVSRAIALRRLIRSIRPDLVHATLFEATMPAHLAVVGTGVPLLVTWANTDDVATKVAESGLPRWKLSTVNMVESVLGRLSGSHYHAVTPGVAEANQRAFRSRPERIHVAERGREPDRFQVDQTAAADLRTEIGLADSAQVVLNVGRHEPAKGQLDLIRRFDEVADSLDRAVLLIAGREGTTTPELRRAASAARHTDRIKLLGPRDDIPVLLAAADILVSSSRREGAAGAVIEAMAARTPIVSTPVQGLIGVLAHRHNALVVPVPELPIAIAELLTDSALAERLAAAAHETFRKRFTVEASSRSLASVYRRVARQARSTQSTS